ncbi:uncharacterized protein LOC113466969 isoform X2 [Diaphorina citri]|uniref:Uncharacterized protein LOC113466969 isoform X1 n=1 Tax=Diaphorina citri TaxID=121845 RepID=A0A3Q0IQV0_DIACI|nr:uncharacterized protein LOC113466969 isoform X1 [Diaphorina citri]XP_026678633.1 uncharacterized protein LOC113466969 isoform X2 [Diaphorina citri]
MHLPFLATIGLMASLSLCQALDGETRPPTSRRVRNPQVIIRAVNTGKSISTSSSVSSSTKNNSANIGLALAAGQSNATAASSYPNPLMYTGARTSPAAGNNGTAGPSTSGSGKTPRNR